MVATCVFQERGKGGLYGRHDAIARASYLDEACRVVDNKLGPHLVVVYEEW